MYFMSLLPCQPYTVTAVPLPRQGKRPAKHIFKKKKKEGQRKVTVEGKVNVKVKVPRNCKVQERAQSVTFPLSTFLFY